MWSFIKKHKLFVSTLFTLTIITAILGVQFDVVPKGQGFTIGQGSVVLRIGTAEASGTVDYVCDGTDDDIQFQGALDALPATGGEIQILSGNYDVGATVTRAIDNVTIRGVGRGTYITYNGANAIFTAGGNNWQFKDLRTDAGSINMGVTTGWSWENITVNATYYAYRTDDATTASSWNIPTGRGATYVIAASDAPAGVKAQADITASANLSADIAVAAGLGYTDILLTEGAFTSTADITVPANTTLRGTNKSTSVITFSGASVAQCVTLNGNNSHVKNLKIIIAAGAGGAGTRPNGVYANGKNWVSAESLTLYGDKTVGDDGDSTRQDGIYFVDVQYSIAKDNDIDNFKRHAIYFNDVGTHTLYSQIMGNRVKSSDYHNIALRGYACTIQSNESVSGGAGGILLIGGQGNSVIGNNDYGSSPSYLINTSGNAHLVIGNTSRSAGTYGIQTTADVYNCKFLGNQIILAGTSPVSILGTDNVVQNTIGYIASGEIRTASGTLTGGAANAILFAWHNPELQDIYIKKVVIVITTADADAANIDVGIADDATYTNGGTEFFDDLTGETILVYDSWIAGDLGTQLKWLLLQDSASATDGWIVAKILTNDGTSIVGSYYIEYVGK